MALSDFLNALFDHGRIALPSPGKVETPAELTAAASVLTEFEQTWSLEFPGTSPALQMDAALWAAQTLYRGAQAAVFRQIEEQDLRTGLRIPGPPSADTPSGHYSVDLTFRFLPDLTQLARGVSSADPLVEVLQDLANRWPLSSVGMKGVQPASLEALASHPGLLQLYVDRILARDDLDRIADERVANVARQTLGAYVELSPTLARRLACFRHE